MMKKKKEGGGERERRDVVSANLFLGDIKALQKEPVMGAQNAEKTKHKITIQVLQND